MRVDCVATRQHTALGRRRRDTAKRKSISSSRRPRVCTQCDTRDKTRRRSVQHDGRACIVLLVGRHPINDLTPSIWSRARTWKIGNIRGGTCNAGGQRGFTAVSREVLAETCSTRSRRSTINAITMNRLRAVTSCRRAGGRHDMPPNQACKW